MQYSVERLRFCGLNGKFLRDSVLVDNIRIMALSVAPFFLMFITVVASSERMGG